jgi:hypothetical protein
MATENEDRENIDRLLPYRAAVANLRKITPTALLEVVASVDPRDWLKRIVRLEKPRH